MTFEFKFPDVGEGIHEGEIVRWRVNVGDEIKEDQPIVEMETAKAIVEIPSPKTGTVLALNGKEGQVVYVGDVLAVIGEKGEKIDGQAQISGTANKPSQSAAGPGVVGQIPTEEKGVTLPPRRSDADAGGSSASAVGGVLPRIRKLAQDLDVNLSKIKGTGPAGQVTEQDVQNAAADVAPENNGPDPESFGPVDRIPVKGIRKAVAEHMVRAKFTIPHVTHMDECDASAMVKLREMQKPEAEKRKIKLTYLPFIIRAAVAALKKFPAMNAEYRDRGTGPGKMQKMPPEIIYKKYYNIGIAVDTPDGLMVPVIRDADKKDIFALAEEIADLAEKCRKRRATAAELAGASFNITNIGSIGGVFATPVITYGQSAVLGVMRMKEKPVAIEGKVEIRPILSLALSFDHRVTDGADAARFMNEIMAGLQTDVL